MRLLETSNSSSVPQMKEFIGSDVPPYAILSHTWQDDEVTLQQLSSSATDPAALQAKAGFRKIQQTCALARTRDALDYAWVDTCCIDKTSSAELSEAINSMYAFYENAAVCYVQLADLEPGNEDALVNVLPRCRWFTRGWTLQELIAPREVLFFDKGWGYRGSKRDLAGLLSLITGIPEALLRKDAVLSDFAVAKRMSWASMRETTRVEDMAYCLLGIFEVNMSLIYGEGLKAFGRLQKAIVQTTPDLSIFAWTYDRVPCREYAGVLAESPRQFARCGDIEMTPGDSIYASFVITNRGVQLQASLVHHASHRNDVLRVVLNVHCTMGGKMLGVPLRKIGGGLYARYNPDIIIDFGEGSSMDLERRGFVWLYVESVTLCTKLPVRFPFSASNPVLGNRHSVLLVQWRGQEILSCLPMPTSHQDLHDKVSFACNNVSRGWCAYFIHCRVGTKRAPLDFFLGCFAWNIGRPRIVLACLNHLDMAAVILLREQLSRFGFECSKHVERLVRVLFEAKLEAKTMEMVPPGGLCTSYWHLKAPGEVTVAMRQEYRPDLCFKPALVLDVYVSEVR
ncbi:Vegetative incompatibility protein HET-E-1 [Madurella mycetomatis]|uniref:Vegetative incompatibility protein HET-E-1 n=1 Tax=Madurella mycetomatis TaxID=100816 RepID=A0A175W9I4_9PEZI|nr:Vegetative incompatibility protein HET-E-1 [Madurella mycetomatis]